MSNHYGENPAPEEDIYKPSPAPVRSEGSVSPDHSPRPSGINSASSEEIAGGYSPRPVAANSIGV